MEAEEKMSSKTKGTSKYGYIQYLAEFGTLDSLLYLIRVLL